VPFIVGLVFFLSGVSLIRQINDRSY
jgi:hypothetical protein